MSETILGSSLQPSVFNLADGTQVALGTVVAEAFHHSGLTAEAWDALPDVEREQKIADIVAGLPLAAAAPEPAPRPQPAPAVTLPASVTLAAPYAYYGEDGGLHSWATDQVVTEPAQIADLLARQAPLKD